MKLKANIVKLLLVLLVSVVGLGTVLPAATVYAAEIANPADRMDTGSVQWVRYRGLYYCWNASSISGNYDYDEVGNADFFTGNTTAIGFENEDGKVDCDDEDFVNNSAKIMGWDNIQDMFCSMSSNSCKDGTYNVGKTSSERAQAFKDAKGQLPDTANYPFDPSGALWYYIYKRTLEERCGGGATLTSESSSTSYESKGVVSAYYVSSTSGEIKRVNYELDGHEDGDTIDDIYAGTGTGGNGDSMDKKCSEISDKTDQHKGDYSSYIIKWYNSQIATAFKAEVNLSNVIKKDCGERPKGDGSEIPTPPEKAYAACVNRVVAQFNASVDKCANSTALNKPMEVNERTKAFKQCMKDELPDKYNTAVNEISDPTFAEEAAGEDGEVSETTCAVDGIGWIVCPAMTFLGKLNDAAFGFLNNLLTIRPALFTDPSTQSAWAAFRDLANIAFIIAFLFIVYSQVTGVGVTNYGIKKLLPRVFIAALLVNLSYVICAIAVDLSNIVGGSVYQLLKDSIPAGTGVKGGGLGSELWSTAIAGVLAVAAGVLLVVIIITAPMVLLALAVVLLILIARQALVIMLIVIAPLAFVAYLLPNTEDWFKKWRKAFVATLMVYPIIGVVFGASTLASNILMNVAQDGAGGGDDEQMLKIVALTVLAIPLFAVPALLKGSLSAAGAIGAKIQGLGDKSTGFAGRKIKEGRLGEAKTAFDARRQQNQVLRRTGKSTGLYGRAAGKVNTAIDNSRFARLIGADRGSAAATAAYHEEARKERERQQATMSELSQDELYEILSNQSHSAERRAAAAQRIAESGGDQHVQRAFDYLSKQGHEEASKPGADKDIGDVQQLSSDALLKRKPKGISTSQASALRTGDLQSDGGYLKMFDKRIKERAFGAADFAEMKKDDLIRLAEMSESGMLDQADIDHIRDEAQKIFSDENLKGTMTGERIALFDSILKKTGPVKADGTPRVGKDGLVPLN